MVDCGWTENAVAVTATELTMEVIKEKARWALGFIVRNGDRYFINNDRGELISRSCHRAATRKLAGLL
jgi:hypothetical protein